MPGLKKEEDSTNHKVLKSLGILSLIIMELK